MKYSIGDEFKIKISQVFENEEGPDLYRINDFKSIVFDEAGLDRLEPIDYAAAVQSGEVIAYNRLWILLQQYVMSHEVDDLKQAISELTVDEFISNNSVTRIEPGMAVTIKEMSGVVKDVNDNTFTIQFELSPQPPVEVVNTDDEDN